MKILYVTTISLTMNSFFKPHVRMLIDEGHCVDIACNYKDLPLDDLYNKLGCNFHQIDFSRRPLSVNNLKAYNQLKGLINKENYDIVHCHTPNASVITRLVCRKFRKEKKLKVYYTAHGFHFYKGAPILNWLVYYPIEKYCSRYTDKLLTINTEDYKLAKNKFKAKEVYYVPGVGIDISKFENVKVDRSAKRKELGVPEDAILLFSVGELNKNKNHQIIIKALAKIGNPNIHYVIAGVGNNKKNLIILSKKLGVLEQLHLVGYKTDIVEIYNIVDLFCLPSIREGLPMALMEAMASGLPVICSDVRGNKDLLNDSVDFLFSPLSLNECLFSLNAFFNVESSILSEKNKSKVRHFSLDYVLSKLKNIYK